MDEIERSIQNYRIMPLVTLERAEQAELLGKVLTECGLNIVEVTFRSEVAAEGIRILTDKFPQILTGAGTVLTIEQARSAIDAGAKFLLAPGLNPEIVRFCQERQIPFYPGCMTPTELDSAYRMGLHTVKIFPFAAMGGLPMLKAMAAPFGKMRFIVTGGIHNENLAEILAYDRILACGGSWLIDQKKLAAGDAEGMKTDILNAVKCVK